MARKQANTDIYEHTAGGGAHVRLTERGAPNLDCRTPSELMAFWHASYVGGWSLARFLFPDRPRGYVAVTGHLGGYASNKATAMTCRERGDIVAAESYERICETIYESLPDWARW